MKRTNMNTSPLRSAVHASSIRPRAAAARGGAKPPLVLVALALLLGAAPRASAVYGVGDTVIIVGDAPATQRWAIESTYWNRLLADSQLLNERAAVIAANSDTLVELMGRTATAAPRLVGSVPDIMKPVEDAVALETAKHAQESSRNLFGLGNKSVKTHRTGRNVDPSFSALGETVTRDEQRYAHFATQEAMLARCRTASSNEDTVAQKETALQHSILDDLKQARTEAEVALLTAKLAASQQRQAAAHQKAVQARADAATFRAQLTVEQERKDEADREWAQAVIDRMRDKALAAYQAQARADGSADR